MQDLMYSNGDDNIALMIDAFRHIQIGHLNEEHPLEDYTSKKRLPFNAYVMKTFAGTELRGIRCHTSENKKCLVRT